MKAIEVHYNWSQHPEHGTDFMFYRVGEYYIRPDLSYARCESITVKTDHGLHVIITFADGTTEHQWGINKIIEAEDGYNYTGQHIADKEPTYMPQPGPGASGV